MTKKQLHDRTMVNTAVAILEADWQKIINGSLDNKALLFDEYEGTHHGKTRLERAYSFNLWDSALKSVTKDGANEAVYVRTIVADFPQPRIGSIANLTQIDKYHYLFRTAHNTNYVVALHLK